MVTSLTGNFYPLPLPFLWTVPYIFYTFVHDIHIHHLHTRRVSFRGWRQVGISLPFGEIFLLPLWRVYINLHPVELSIVTLHLSCVSFSSFHTCYSNHFLGKISSIHLKWYMAKQKAVQNVLFSVLEIFLIFHTILNANELKNNLQE